MNAYHCSYTTIATWMGDILQVPVCRGYLAKLCNGVISDSLSDAYEELEAAIASIAGVEFQADP